VKLALTGGGGSGPSGCEQENSKVAMTSPNNLAFISTPSPFCDRLITCGGHLSTISARLCAAMSEHLRLLIDDVTASSD
jgi:hypothetical protein